MRTWKVLKLDIETVGEIALQCPNCELESIMPIGKTSSPIIAACGLTVILDKPQKDAPQFLPTEIQCRKCGKIYSQEEY